MQNIKKIRLDGLSHESFEDLMESDIVEAVRLLDGLKEKKFVLADIDIDHRAILHWEKEGLIEKQSDAGKWRRFSFFDYLWLRIIKDMREFGLPISVIKKVQLSLFELADEDMLNLMSEEDLDRTKTRVAKAPDIGEEALALSREDLLAEASNESYFTWMEVFSLAVIVSRSPTCLFISLDGDVDIISLQPKIMSIQLESLVSLLAQRNWLVINITKIISEFYEKEELNDAVYYNMTPLSYKEKEIVEIIRAGGVSNVNITLKNGKEFYVEILRKKPARKILEEIEGIIAKRKYSRITLDSENGKVTYINEIEKRIIR